MKRLPGEYVICRSLAGEAEALELVLVLKARFYGRESIHIRGTSIGEREAAICHRNELQPRNVNKS